MLASLRAQGPGQLADDIVLDVQIETVLIVVRVIAFSSRGGFGLSGGRLSARALGSRAGVAALFGLIAIVPGGFLRRIVTIGAETSR